VYLAGPEVFLPDAIAVGAAKKALCTAAGFEGVFPLDMQVDIEGLAPQQAAERIYQACETLMSGCDLCIANATPFRGVSMDVGTAFEVGFMRAQGKPVFAYTNAAGLYPERVRDYRRLGRSAVFDADAPDVQIEDFDAVENLMIAVAVARSGVPLRPAEDGPARIGDLQAFQRCLRAVVDARFGGDPGRQRRS
jgi:nucleoside 2-deoxyribosyltransferase